VRLRLALDEEGLILPETGRIAVIAPSVEFDLSILPRDRVDVVQSFYPHYTAFSDLGYTCIPALGENNAACLICLPRNKQQARALIAQAEAATPGGLILIDGQKVSGIESVLRELRGRVQILGTVSKAHGKLIWFMTQGDCFADWAQPTATKNKDGFHTVPGIFSADEIDPASALLVASLPQKLGGVVADMGAGWGYLSSQIFTRDSVEQVHLIEAEQIALDCARRNITDQRAEFHWADATTWTPAQTPDSVVMNPPFHIGRRGKPALGQAFIAAAAAVLGQSGHLWMVANRHLPYEAVLNDLFVKVEETPGTSKFKVLHAHRPVRWRR
jgi:16S rRNA (guanine1207-N2)-methyltransferase